MNYAVMPGLSAVLMPSAPLSSACSWSLERWAELAEELGKHSKQIKGVNRWPVTGGAGGHRQLCWQPRGQASAPQVHRLPPALGSMPVAAACPTPSAGRQDSRARRKESRSRGQGLVVPGSSAETHLLGEAGGVPLGKGRVGSRVQLPGPVRGTPAAEGCPPAPGSLWAQSWHPRQPMVCVSTDCAALLGLAGIGLICFLGAGIALCFDNVATKRMETPFP